MKPILIKKLSHALNNRCCMRSTGLMSHYRKGDGACWSYFRFDHTESDTGVAISLVSRLQTTTKREQDTPGRDLLLVDREETKFDKRIVREIIAT